MVITNIEVNNFRSLRNVRLDCDALTALIGANGSGKSSVLQALSQFYDPAADYSETDFFDHSIGEPFVISVTFGALGAEELQLFKDYVQNGSLTVEKVHEWPRTRTSQRYYGKRLRCGAFGAVRVAEAAAAKKAAYEEIRKRDGFGDLPGWQSMAAAEEAMGGWEVAHPSECERMRDGGQFFGFREVGEARLERYTRFLMLPAVRDAAEEGAEGRGSPLSEMMEIVVRNAIASSAKWTGLQERVREEYGAIVESPEVRASLAGLAAQLTNRLRMYVPGSEVRMSWEGVAAPELPLPKGRVWLVEDGYPAPVGQTGHGLQRAFYLSMLQNLALVRHRAATEEGAGAGETGDTSGQAGGGPATPDFVLAIEEPELFLHPSRQRLFAQTLVELASSKIAGVFERTQVIYCSHSPLFVAADRFGEVRLLRKRRGEDGKPKETEITMADLGDVAREIERAVGVARGVFSAETILPRLQAIMTPWMNEGFFADVVVLVEGEGDRAAILGAATSMGHSLDSLGVSVIPCMGKNNLDRPAAMFRLLGIPVYCVWDNDHRGKDAKPEDNRRLLRLLGREEEDWPCGADAVCACLGGKLETELAGALGEAYEEKLGQCCEDYQMRRDDAKKNATVIGRIVRETHEEGLSCGFLEEIVQRVMALYEGSQATRAMV